MKATEDGFSSIFDSEKCGVYTCNEHYTEQGVTMVSSEIGNVLFRYRFRFCYGNRF
jgi:hypothetical protein